MSSSTALHDVKSAATEVIREESAPDGIEGALTSVIRRRVVGDSWSKAAASCWPTKPPAPVMRIDMINYLSSAKN